MVSSSPFSFCPMPEVLRIFLCLSSVNCPTLWAQGCPLKSIVALQVQLVFIGRRGSKMGNLAKGHTLMSLGEYSTVWYFQCPRCGVIFAQLNFWLFPMYLMSCSTFQAYFCWCWSGFSFFKRLQGDISKLKSSTLCKLWKPLPLSDFRSRLMPHNGLD